MVFWEIPGKNPEAVDLYRVFWRPVGSRTANKTDTITPKVVLTELTPGVTYEVDIYYNYLFYCLLFIQGGSQGW